MCRTGIGIATAVLLAWAAVAAAEGDRNPGPPKPPPAPPKPEAPKPGEEATIEGRVVSRSGNPLPPWLEVVAEGAPRTKRASRSEDQVLGDDGRFTIEGLVRERSYTLVVRTRGFGLVLGKMERVASGSRDITVTLDPGGTIEGRVLDAKGDPVGPGVLVAASRTWPEYPFMRMCGNPGPGEDGGTRTRKGGTFTIEFLGDFVFELHSSRDEPPDVETEIASGSWIPVGSTDVVLQLGPRPRYRPGRREPSEPTPHRPAPTAITGRLLTEPATEIPYDFVLKVVPEAGGEERRLWLPRSGAFDTGRLAPGRYTFLALACGRFPCGESKEVEAGSRDVAIPLDLHGSIAGRVFGADGSPAGSGLLVMAAPRDWPNPCDPGGTSTTWTREDGTFVVGFLRHGPFRVAVHPDPLGRETLACWGGADLKPGTTAVDLRLERPVTMSGTVTDSDDKPLPKCEVVARQDRLFGWDHDDCRKDGAFSLRKLLRGKVRILVRVDKVEHDLGEFEAPSERLVLRLPGK